VAGSVLRIASMNRAMPSGDPALARVFLMKVSRFWRSRSLS
jgi:hypothetical protein